MNIQKVVELSTLLFCEQFLFFIIDFLTLK